MFKYTEKFLSFQGEGHHTGKNTVWLRLFQCNLECRGFGQKNPADPSSYAPVGNDMDLIDIKVLEDLPVFEYGCDSAYSVSRRYEHLVYSGSANDICNDLESLITSDYNTGGKFLNSSSGEYTHLCFTGGEPMLRPNQKAIMAIVREFHQRGNMPYRITVETNGTQKLSPEFVKFIEWFYDVTNGEGEWFWSVSPKLHNTSGEHNDIAIKPEIVKSYQDLVRNNTGQLKFVVNGSNDTWIELSKVVDQFRKEGVVFPVWVMPVGSLKEHQESDIVKDIVYEALKRGYHISGRLHAYMLGNGMNT